MCSCPARAPARNAGAPIVTEIVPATTFWEAEEYHQQYLRKRGAGRCADRAGDC